MFQNFTFEMIMNRMLDNVPNDLDKREGSIIWDALAPAALELETAYLFLDFTLNQSFADTADRDFLILRARERGLTPYEASYAILKGSFVPTDADVAGKRFNIGTLNYQVGEAIEGEPGCYQMICETAGAEGHKRLGTMIPIDFVDGLESATATEILIPGEDEEDTEDFRMRFLNDFNPSRFGGNIAQYIDWVMAIEGVGGVRVARRSAGERDVIVTIIDSEYNKASSTLVQTVQEKLDPNQDGSGEGIAPIGHEVTVVTADNQTINVYLDVDFDTGYSWATMQQAIKDVIDNYMLELRTSWKDYNSGVNTIVRISQIETKVLALTGVIDVNNTKINGTASNFAVTDNKIPVLGVVTHG